LEAIHGKIIICNCQHARDIGTFSQALTHALYNLNYFGDHGESVGGTSTDSE